MYCDCDVDGDGNPVSVLHIGPCWSIWRHNCTFAGLSHEHLHNELPAIAGQIQVMSMLLTLLQMPLDKTFQLQVMAPVAVKLIMQKLLKVIDIQSCAPFSIVKVQQKWMEGDCALCSKPATFHCRKFQAWWGCKGVSDDTIQTFR